MYEYSPKPDRRLPSVAVFLCLFIGIFLFAPLPISESFILWMRAVGIWSFAAAFMIADRYLLMSYTYLIEENENGTLDFIVSELHFKRRRTVCRIAVADIDRVEFIKKGNSFDPGKKVRTFNYRSDFLSSDFYVLSGETSDGRFFIKFSPDAKMINIINGFLMRKN